MSLHPTRSDHSSDEGPILFGERLTKVFSSRKRKGGSAITAVDNVTFTLQQGETIGIVGESGSGKSTLARLLLGLETPTAGTVHYRGEEIIGPASSMPRALRREIQFVAQDPYSNLDPRMKVGRIVSQGWRCHPGVVDRTLWRETAIELLERVGIEGVDTLDRYPHEFSGGQRQRIAIARALALRPSVLILDEPISSLDVSVQAQVLELLQGLQEAEGLSYVFIAHDLSVVEYFAHSVAVMYRGRIVEKGPSEAVFARPQHPYTEMLRGSIPTWRPDGSAVIQPPPETGGDVDGSDGERPACVFHHRCAFRTDVCSTTDPHDNWRIEGPHRYACFHPMDEHEPASRA